MNWWALIRRFPKFIVVAVVLIGSTTLFGIWWFTHSPRKLADDHAAEIQQEQDTARKVAEIEAKMGHLILADNDLYNVDTGELIFQNWLSEGMPLKLSYDAPSKKLVARYKNGFVRYNLDGSENAKLLQRFTMVISDDNKWVVYVKDKDIWRADVDWQAFKLTNEKQVTSIGLFQEPFFAENIALGTDKTLVVRNLMKLLRVDLETGDVHPAVLPRANLARQRSPDSKSIVGIQNGKLYCYDVDSDSAKTTPAARLEMNDLQWLGNDRAACVLNEKVVATYDLASNALTEICQLPILCTKIGEPSPDGRYIFCANNRQGVLVDLQGKTATPVTGGAGITWVSNDTFAFSRDVSDSNLRGTWIYDGKEKRIYKNPCITIVPINNDSERSVAYIFPQNIFVLSDGGYQTKLETIVKPCQSILGLSDWKYESY